MSIFGNSNGKPPTVDPADLPDLTDFDHYAAERERLNKLQDELEALRQERARLGRERVSGKRTARAEAVEAIRRGEDPPSGGNVVAKLTEVNKRVPLVEQAVKRQEGRVREARSQASRAVAKQLHDDYERVLQGMADTLGELVAYAKAERDIYNALQRRGFLASYIGAVPFRAVMPYRRNSPLKVWIEDLERSERYDVKAPEVP